MKWKNPPVSRTGAYGRSMYEVIGNELINHPEKWAMIRENVWAATKTTALNALLKYCDSNRERWEVVSRTENDQVNIYARYMPNGKK